MDFLDLSDKGICLQLLLDTRLDVSTKRIIESYQNRCNNDIERVNLFSLFYCQHDRVLEQMFQNNQNKFSCKPYKESIVSNNFEN